MNATGTTGVSFSDGGSLMQTANTFDQTNLSDSLTSALNAAGMTGEGSLGQTGGSWATGDASSEAAQDGMSMSFGSFKGNYDAPLLPKRDFELRPPEPIVIADIGDEENRPRDNNYYEFDFKNGDRYEGMWKGGMLCGFGKYIKEGGAEFAEGQWDNDVLCGKGEHTQSDGRVYIGSFKRGLRHGRGKIVLPKNGGQFECEFRDGAMLGKASRINYIMFEGKTGRRMEPLEAKMIPGYKNTLNQDEPPKPRAEARRRYDVSAGGRRHEFGIDRGGYNPMLDPVYRPHSPKSRKFLSKGAAIYKEGLDEQQVAAFSADDQDEVYKGGMKMCSDGIRRRYGFGTVKWGNELKNRYTGDWLYDEKHGKGERVWETGEVYNGTWVHNQMEGKGSYRWPNGAKYNGEFVQGKKCGFGVQIWPTIDRTGVVEYEGQWVDNKQTGQGKLKRPDGRTYEGEWLQGRIQGRGVLTYANGWTYKGEFYNDLKHGVGVKTEWYTGGHGRRYRVWYRFNVLVKRRDVGPCSREDVDPEYPEYDVFVKAGEPNRAAGDAKQSDLESLLTFGGKSFSKLKLKLKLDLTGVQDAKNQTPLPFSPPRSPPFSPTDDTKDKGGELKYPIGNWSFGERGAATDVMTSSGFTASVRRGRGPRSCGTSSMPNSTLQDAASMLREDSRAQDFASFNTRDDLFRVAPEEIADAGREESHVTWGGREESIVWSEAGGGSPMGRQQSSLSDAYPKREQSFASTALGASGVLREEELEVDCSGGSAFTYRDTSNEKLLKKRVDVLDVEGVIPRTVIVAATAATSQTCTVKRAVATSFNGCGMGARKFILQS